MLCKRGSLGQGAIVAFFIAVSHLFLVSCDREEIKALGSSKKPQGRVCLPILRGPRGQVRVLVQRHGFRARYTHF